MANNIRVGLIGNENNAIDSDLLAKFGMIKRLFSGVKSIMRFAVGEATNIEKHTRCER